MKLTLWQTKYRRKVFDSAAIDRLKSLFAKTCSEFGSEWVEMDGEGDPVHLLVNYPPKVAVSALVNSLKGVSSRMLRQERPEKAKQKNSHFVSLLVLYFFHHRITEQRIDTGLVTLARPL